MVVSIPHAMSDRYHLLARYVVLEPHPALLWRSGLVRKRDVQHIPCLVDIMPNNVREAGLRLHTQNPQNLRVNPRGGRVGANDFASRRRGLRGLPIRDE